MTERKIELTRRKILLGTGAVGAAGAGAGIGTSALFSDEEEFANNSLTAGTLDMSVTGRIVEANEYYTSSGDGPDIIGSMETADGAVETGIQATDVKPGDWVIICFDISIDGNPGYVHISADDFAQYENGQTEPESQVDSSGGGSLGQPLDGQGEGELQNKMVAEVYSDYDDSVSSDDPRDYLSGKDPSLSGSAKTAFEQFATGVTLGGSSDPTEVGPSNSPQSVYLLLEVPKNVGNEIQSDAIEFDLVFETEQVRNNDDPFDDGSGSGGSGSSQVTVQGFPGSADSGRVIEGVDVTFSNAFSNVVGTSWSVGPTGTENITVSGNTVELRYPNNSKTYSSDTFLELTVDGVSTGGQTAEFVFEPDDGSSVDATDTY